MLIGVDFSADTLGSVTAGATAEIENQCRRTDHLSRHNRAHLWFTKRSWSGSIAVELHVRLFLLRHSEANPRGTSAPVGSRPSYGLNRPISAHFQGVARLRASVTILVSRLERRCREVSFGSVLRNISSTC